MSRCITISQPAENRHMPNNIIKYVVLPKLSSITMTILRKCIKLAQLFGGLPVPWYINIISVILVNRGKRLVDLDTNYPRQYMYKGILCMTKLFGSSIKKMLQHMD